MSLEWGSGNAECGNVGIPVLELRGTRFAWLEISSPLADISLVQYLKIMKR